MRTSRSSLVDDFQFSLALLRHIAQSHGEEAVNYTPFEEFLEVELAEDAGPVLAGLVDDLKAHPAVRQIEGDMPYLLGVSSERSYRNVDELWPQIHAAIDNIGVIPLPAAKPR